MLGWRSMAACVCLAVQEVWAATSLRCGQYSPGSQHVSRGVDNQAICWRRLRGGAISMDDISKAANDPELLAELQRMMEDPAAMAEYQELMNDPEFRRQMTEAMAKGGDKLGDITNAISQNTELSEALEYLGPSLGACIDALKRTATVAEDLDGALSVLESLAHRLASKGSAEAKFRRVRLSNDALQSRLLQFGGGESALKALGFRTELSIDGEAHLEHDGVGLSADGSLSPAMERMTKLLADTRAEMETAMRISTEHGLPFALTIECAPLAHRFRTACAPLAHCRTLQAAPYPYSMLLSDAL